MMPPAPETNKIAEVTGQGDGTYEYGIDMAGHRILSLQIENTAGSAGTNTYTLWAANQDDGAVCAGVLTLTGLPLDTETVIIGGKVYTFQTVLTNVDGNVLIGADVDESIANLVAAITRGAGAGTKYAATMTGHPTVTTAKGAGDTMNAIARAPGPRGDSIATTETLTNGSWGATTLVDPCTYADVTNEWLGAASFTASAHKTTAKQVVAKWVKARVVRSVDGANLDGAWTIRVRRVW